MVQTAQLTKEELKTAVHRIVLAQGNVFIRELLRDHGLTIGLTKKDFGKNLDNAIDEGTFTQAMLEAWVIKVEGWGDQHIYLHQAPKLSPAEVQALLEASPFRALVGQSVSYQFPQSLSLTSMMIGAHGVSIIWHQSTSGWKRDDSKDEVRVIDDDRYEFRAFRERFDRAVVRFEWRFTDPYCAVLMQLPHEGNVHGAALGVVWGDLASIGIAKRPLDKIPLSDAFKRLSRNTDIVVRTSKRMAAGGYVELGATLPDTSISAVDGVKELLKGVTDDKFHKADGVFGLDKATHSLEKTIKFQGYGDDSRLRVWVQCKRDDIFFLLKLVHEHQKTA